MTREELTEGVAIRALSDNPGHWSRGEVRVVRKDADGDYYIECDDGGEHLLNENDGWLSCLPDFEVAPQ